MFGLCLLAITIPVATFAHFYFEINSIYEDSKEDSSDSSTEAYVTNDAVISDNITNILLIGTDARSKQERGRSDTMMIATIDEKHRSIKLTSLARDTYIDIPGHGKEKLNHAYSYGGAKLLTQTLEKNLSIDISNYVIVNFNSFSSIIDALGGVTVEVKESELNELNKFIPECYEASSKGKNSKMKLVEKSGVQTLNGYQALSYSRIRKNDSALERDNRQRKVLQALMDEASNMSILEIPKVLKAVLPHLKTDMDFSDMVDTGKKVLKMGNFKINQLEFPIQEHSKSERIDGKGWVIKFNEEKCVRALHEFIFEDESLYSGSEDSEDVVENNTSSKDEANSVLEDFLDNDNNTDSSIDNISPLKPEDYFNDSDNDRLNNLNTEEIPFI